MRIAPVGVLTCLLAGVGAAAGAQVRPIPEPRPQAPEPAPPRRPIAPERPTARPVLPTVAVRPRLTVIDQDAPMIAGRPRTLTVRLTGLGDARAVHLFRFRPGCHFEQTPGIAGVPLRTDLLVQASGRSDRAYTTSGVGNARAILRIQSPVGDGLPVVDGVAELQTVGVPGSLGGVFVGELEREGITEDFLFVEGGTLRGFGRSVAPENRECTPSAIVLVRGADDRWVGLRPDGSRLTDLNSDDVGHVTGPAWTMRGARRVTVTETAQLRTLLAPVAFGGGGSVCSGTSQALGSPSHRVGVLEEGNDLVFRIRSGPAGTSCGFRLGPAALPAGTLAVNARFSVRRDGTQCRVGLGTFQLADLLGLGPRAPLSRLADMLADPVRVDAGSFDASATGWVDPFSLPDGGLRFAWQSHLAPMVATLGCEITALNDHGISMRFDAIDFLVPDGVTFP